MRFMSLLPSGSTNAVKASTTQTATRMPIGRFKSHMCASPKQLSCRPRHDVRAGGGCDPRLQEVVLLETAVFLVQTKAGLCNFHWLSYRPGRPLRRYSGREHRCCRKDPILRGDPAISGRSGDKRFWNRYRTYIYIIYI